MDQRYGREGRGREPREGDLRRQRLGTDPLDQRVDRWVTAGRQFVEGVAGSRPSGRPAPRAGDRRPGRRPRFDDLGRWVEDRLDWLLEDGDDWREPWQEEGEALRSSTGLSLPRRRSAAADRGWRRCRAEAAPPPGLPSLPLPAPPRSTARRVWGMPLRGMTTGPMTPASACPAGSAPSATPRPPRPLPARVLRPSRPGAGAGLPSPAALQPSPVLNSRPPSPERGQEAVLG